MADFTQEEVIALVKAWLPASTKLCLDSLDEAMQCSTRVEAAEILYADSLYWAGELFDWANGMNKHGKILGQLSKPAVKGANCAWMSLVQLRVGGMLRDSIFYRTMLTCPDFRGATLINVDFGGAQLYSADFRGATLLNVDFTCARLIGAKFDGASLRKVRWCLTRLDGSGGFRPSYGRQEIPKGDLIGWKQLADRQIAKLLIPAGARRVMPLGSRKCRAEYAKVLEIRDEHGRFVRQGTNLSCGSLQYTVGDTVYPDTYDHSITKVCTHGIHFFLTREEAKDY